MTSPVARCVCHHLYNAHNGPCQGARARGRCKCSAFEYDHEFQPHVDTLTILTREIKANGFAPSVRQLAAMLGVKSSATMNTRLDVLESAGLIVRVGPHAIRLMEVSK